MSTASLNYLQTFKTLPLTQQIQVSQAINQYLMDYMSNLTSEIEANDYNSWQLFSKQNLAKAFGEDEVEYSISDLKPAN